MGMYMKKYSQDFVIAIIIMLISKIAAITNKIKLYIT